MCYVQKIQYNKSDSTDISAEQLCVMGKHAEGVLVGFP
jgi:hypothetical protein